MKKNKSKTILEDLNKLHELINQIQKRFQKDFNMCFYCKSEITHHKKHCIFNNIEFLKSYYKGNYNKTYNFPNSYRFCYNCEEYRVFTYNKTIGHSACNECGYFGKDSKKWKGVMYNDKKL